MLLLRLGYDPKKKSARTQGELVWNPPWGGQIKLNEHVEFKVHLGVLHVLVKLPGDLMLYVGRSDRMTMAVLDSSKAEKPLDLTTLYATCSDQVKYFGEAVVTVFVKNHGEVGWTCNKKAAAAA